MLLLILVSEENVLGGFEYFLNTKSNYLLVSKIELFLTSPEHISCNKNIYNDVNCNDFAVG